MKVLPGISAEDCLFADLLIDPGSAGCLSLEATDLLLYSKKLNTDYHLIIWQAGIIGALDHPKLHDNTNGIKLLLKYLRQYYNLDHPIILYSAAQYPGLEPLIIRSTLENLLELKLSRISTLYLPPLQKTSCDKTMLNELKINITDII